LAQLLWRGREHQVHTIAQATLMAGTQHCERSASAITSNARVHHRRTSLQNIRVHFRPANHQRLKVATAETARHRKATASTMT
jgi:hypothetical protein